MTCTKPLVFFFCGLLHSVSPSLPSVLAFRLAPWVFVWLLVSLPAPKELQFAVVHGLKAIVDNTRKHLKRRCPEGVVRSFVQDNIVLCVILCKCRKGSCVLIAQPRMDWMGNLARLTRFGRMKQCYHHAGLHGVTKSPTREHQSQLIRQHANGNHGKHPVQYWCPAGAKCAKVAVKGMYSTSDGMVLGASTDESIVVSWVGG